MQRKFAFALFAVLTLALAMLAQAGSPKIKKYRSFEDFIKGESKGIAISYEGYLSLAPNVEAWFESQSPHIWRIVQVGKSFYAGAGSPAAVYRISAKGDTSTVFQSDAAAIFALAADAQGNVWFAPSPGGDVYRYRNGDVQKIASLDVTYVWDLLPADGQVLVATGEPGDIYRLSADGKAEKFYESKETHIRTLARDAAGRIYAGSADKGLLFRFDARGNPFVLYDSPQSEIFAILPRTDGRVWIACASEGLRRPTPSGARVSLGELRIESEGREERAPRPSVPSPAPSLGRVNPGAVYLVAENGVAKNVWEGLRDRVQAMAPYADGSILVGTGDNGKIYQVFPNGDINLLLDLEPAQITALLPLADGRMAVGTSNLGKGFFIQKTRVREGEYLSPVIDAKINARWGSASWRGEGSIQLFVRSGNSEKPDNTWSSWFGPLTDAGGATIQAPNARFLQWRAVLKRGNREARLEEVAIGYMQENVPPEIASITIYKPGVAFPDAVSEGKKQDDEAGNNRNSSSRPRSSRSYKRETRQGYQSVGWKAEDPNEDELTYHVYYRRVDSPVWRTLVEDYSATVYSWDSRTLEDGKYVVKVVVSDKKSNPPGQELTHEKISKPFVIDNTAPEISPLKLEKGSDPRVRFTAEDAGTRVSSAFYALDAQKWQLLYPDDGIADSPREHFTIRLPDLKPGEHILTVKVFDENNNVRYRHLKFRW